MFAQQPFEPSLKRGVGMQSLGLTAHDVGQLEGLDVATHTISVVPPDVSGYWRVSAVEDVEMG